MSDAHRSRRALAERSLERSRRSAAVIATAQEDIRAGDSIEIDTRTGQARRASFGDATAAQIGTQELNR